MILVHVTSRCPTKRAGRKFLVDGRTDTRLKRNAFHTVTAQTNYAWGLRHGLSIRSLRRAFILGVTEEFWAALCIRSAPIWLCSAAIRPLVASRSRALPPPPAAAPEPSKCHRSGDTCRYTCFGFRVYTCVTKSTKQKDTFSNVNFCQNL